jgi:hypothetical protein
MADFVPGGARLSPNFTGPVVAGRRLARWAERAIFGAMADPEKELPERSISSVPEFGREAV